MTDSIIFDLDGTLWNTTSEIFKCYQQYFPNITLWKLRKLMGKDTKQIAKELYTEIETIQKIQDSEIQWLSDHPVEPYIGVVSLMQYLSTEKIPCYIVSNCQERYIECFLYTSGLAQFFRNWLCFGDNGCDKATNIKTIIERHNLKNPIFVGDTEGDREAASCNHIRFIWAGYGLGEVNNYDGVINHPLDLARYI